MVTLSTFRLYQLLPSLGSRIQWINKIIVLNIYYLHDQKALEDIRLSIRPDPIGHINKNTQWLISN